MKKIIFILITGLLFTTNVQANTDMTVNSKSAILMESSTGEIIYEKNSKEQLAPASMTKIASMLLVMEAIDNGKISLNDTVTISKNAASMGGSQIFLEEGEVYKVSELLKGVAIASGNDAVVALAEKVAGSEDAFVKMMNDKCAELGCTNTSFQNPHGLDEENHYSTAYDMAILARELLKYEDILNYTKIYEEYLERNDGTKTWLVNTNKLIRYYPGVDGLKTGFTDLAGYCLTSTAIKNDLRLISVVMNASTSEGRSEDTVNMLNYGFNTYKLFLIKEKDVSLGKVEITNGKEEMIDVYLKNDATDLQKITDSNKTYEFKIMIDEITAPFKAGDVVGKAQIIDNEDSIVDEVDIIVKEDVNKANFLDYVLKNIKMILSGK